MRTDRNRTERERVGSARRLSSIANFWKKKIPAIFRGISGMFRRISLFLFILSTISSVTPNDGPRNPGLETLS